MAERKVTKTVGEDSITFEFASGQKEVISMKDFQPEIQRQLMLHGASQKLGDSYSGEDADKCHGIFVGLLKSLQDGNWSSRASGSGPRISQLADALARVTEQKVEDCVEKLAGMTDEEKASVRKHPQIVAALADIKLEKATADAAKAKKEAKSADAPALPTF